MRAGLLTAAPRPLMLSRVGEWEETKNSWGSTDMGSASAVTEMPALGWDCAWYEVEGQRRVKLDMPMVFKPLAGCGGAVFWSPLVQRLRELQIGR